MKQVLPLFRIGMIFLGLASTCARPITREADVGVAVPLVVTGSLLQTYRAELTDPTAASLTAGFRALLMPQIKLGPHWFAYSAVQVRSTPFFYQDAYDAERKLYTSWYRRACLGGVTRKK